jgi:hypothetical protein
MIMTLKSQFLLSERQKNLRDKIFLTEPLTGRQTIQNQQMPASQEESGHCHFDSKTWSLPRNDHVTGCCKHGIAIVLAPKPGLVTGYNS